VPSVSTVLAATVANDGLRFWRAKVGEEEANRVSSTAAAKGTLMHSAIEKFLVNSGADGSSTTSPRHLAESVEDSGNELLHSMSAVVNNIAQKDSR